ncbi:MAG: crossover junction endodeoxyribonuclease RuvC [Bacteroidetes bacterium]|nr:crossover junction endodeoxyribonuclease RuvC [Bacteroidota bacterium]
MPENKPSNSKVEKIILGIDPGTVIMGYGLVHVKGTIMTMITAEAIHIKSSFSHYEKLKYIYNEIKKIIDRYQPQEVAIEAPFYGKNAQVMLKLGRAQGSAITAALNENLPVFEYAPRRIKQSITGRGTSSKEQVAAMLKQLLKFKKMPEHLDITDALAVAVCHAMQNRVAAVNGSKKYKDWGTYVKDNPTRIKNP